jgi:tRNA threonylcarbamoyladenosine biosynthesis protein TsaE
MNPKRDGRCKSHCIEVLSRSPLETHRLGIALAEFIPVPGVILLLGTLGTGKTTLTRGIAQGLGLEEPALVSSPSFTLVNIYHGRCPIYHVDLYRLTGDRDLYSTGIDDFLGKDGVTIVEWGERLLYPLEAAIRVEIEDAGGDSRILRLSLGHLQTGRLFKLGSDIGIVKNGQKTIKPGEATKKFSN